MRYAGIVEGFYWKKHDTVEGEYAEYNSKSRRRLLEFMGRVCLNLYVYDPKVLRGEEYERAYHAPLIGDHDDWRRTFDTARSQGVDFLWGLVPAWSGTWLKNERGLLNVIDTVLELGAGGLALLFDDIAANTLESEMEEQAKLVNNLCARYPGRIRGFCPGLYHGLRCDVERALYDINEQMNRSVPFFFTGHQVCPDHISASNIPRHAGGRGIILWDNWMAADTGVPEKLRLAPPRLRQPDLASVLEGYVLNPCYPVERVIPVVSAVAEMVRRWNLGQDLPGDAECADIMASDWANYLGEGVAPLRALIWCGMGHRVSDWPVDEISSLVSRWPSLQPVFDWHMNLS